HDLTLADINVSGGNNGRPLEITVEFDQFQAPQSVLLLRKLYANNAVTVLGPLTGTSWESVAPLANQMKLPAICWTALKSGVSARPYALRIHPPNDTLLVEGLAEFKKLYPNVRRVAIAGDEQEATGAEAIQLYSQAAKDLGMTVVTTTSFQTRTTDFSAVAIAIRSANPDALLSSGLNAPTLGLLKELETQGFDKLVFCDASVWAGGFIPTGGTAGKNVHTVGFSTNEPRPGDARYNSFVERYLKRSAETTNLPQPANVCNTSLAYDAVVLLADILRKGGVGATTTTEQMREIVKNGLQSMQRWDGINKVALRKSGDGHIQGNLLKADIQQKIWRFALPLDQRLTKPAPAAST
ncbi:MAG: ABC transporter substrate-binding protein, partial [Burkholderiaceae bacterium]|nr:ABC transporter substrate-binding protein [Burkholderiaceae bacterium]